MEGSLECLGGPSAGTGLTVVMTPVVFRGPFEDAWAAATVLTEWQSRGMLHQAVLQRQSWLQHFITLSNIGKTQVLQIPSQDHEYFNFRTGSQ